MRLDSGNRFLVCLDFICVQQDAAHRLILKVDVPSLDIFNVCEVPEGDAYDGDAVAEVPRRLRLRKDRCDDCVDVTFAGIWVPRLLDMGTAIRRRSHTALRDVLAVLRLASTLVEKQHLIGHELRPKKRGAAPECDSIAR